MRNGDGVIPGPGQNSTNNSGHKRLSFKTKFRLRRKTVVPLSASELSVSRIRRLFARCVALHVAFPFSDPLIPIDGSPSSFSRRELIHLATDSLGMTADVRPSPTCCMDELMLQYVEL